MAIGFSAHDANVHDIKVTPLEGSAPAPSRELSTLALLNYGTGGSSSKQCLFG
jgi:hypothetical protein